MVIKMNGINRKKKFIVNFINNYLIDLLKKIYA